MTATFLILHTKDKQRCTAFSECNSPHIPSVVVFSRLPLPSSLSDWCVCRHVAHVVIISPTAAHNLKVGQLTSQLYAFFGVCFCFYTCLCVSVSWSFSCLKRECYSAQYVWLHFLIDIYWQLTTSHSKTGWAFSWICLPSDCHSSFKNIFCICYDRTVGEVGKKMVESETWGRIGQLPNRTRAPWVTCSTFSHLSHIWKHQTDMALMPTSREDGMCMPTQP